LRAGIVGRPEEYRWNSLGYHVQTNNRDNFLSTDFGPGEMRFAVTSELHGAGLKEFNVQSENERIIRYRRYVYEAGAIKQPGKGRVKVIKDRVLERERDRGFELSKSDRFSTARAFLRILGSSALKTLFQRIICVSSITLIQKMKKSQNLSGSYRAFIL
jgi:hypothetical protein